MRSVRVHHLPRNPPDESIWVIIGLTKLHHRRFRSRTDIPPRQTLKVHQRLELCRGGTGELACDETGGEEADRMGREGLAVWVCGQEIVLK